jgi:hypothetical protein
MSFAAFGQSVMRRRPRSAARTHYQHDFDALRAASTRIVIARGADCDAEMAYRAAFGVAERLGTTVVGFPGGHGGSSAASTA